ncbi:hypothetical protein PVK06_025237 [Gossypium arboreum]|uniref:Uncharacterized protein n=1 Tax=Gossypium arboreum TaxID=29729 RepID=A0ABR0PFY3_GOSAR|nr:hypothetical protein PVK06_025237 [Gossypium arboreum]
MDFSAQIWNTLATIYGSKTTSRLMFYRSALHSQRKGDLSMKDFLIKVKGYCDSLASCVITIITASQLPSNVQNITTMLLAAEVQIQSTVVEIPNSANMVTHQQNASVVNNDSTPAYCPALGSSHGHGHGRMSGSHIQCQLYGKTGYLVDHCYHRFDVTYKSTGYRPPQKNVCMFGNGSSMSS